MSSRPQTLRDVCEFIEDCLHATAPVVDDGYPLIRTPNIGRGRLNLEGVYRVSEEIYEIWTKRAVPQDDDLIFAREAPPGNIAIIKNGDKVCLGQRTVHLRPNKSIVNPDFLCYFLLSPYQQSKLLSGATGATATHVNMKDIRGLILDELPSLTSQKKIGEILATYDDLIENNHRRMTLLEDYARHIHREWFVRLRFPGTNKTRTNRCVLKNLCDDIRDSVLPENIETETPYIGLEHIPRRSITLCNWGTAEEVTSTKLRFKEGDVIFGKIRPYFHKVGFALVDGVSSSDSIVMRPVKDDFRCLVLLTTSSDEFVAHTSQTMREGSKMPRADWKIMREYPVLLPPDSLLRTFNTQIEPILQQLKNLAFQNRKLQVTRELLLPRLMSGEIPV